VERTNCGEVYVPPSKFILLFISSFGKGIRESANFDMPLSIVLQSVTSTPLFLRVIWDSDPMNASISPLFSDF